MLADARARVPSATHSCAQPLAQARDRALPAAMALDAAEADPWGNLDPEDEEFALAELARFTDEAEIEGMSELLGTPSPSPASSSSVRSACSATHRRHASSSSSSAISSSPSAAPSAAMPSATAGAAAEPPATATPEPARKRLRSKSAPRPGIYGAAGLSLPVSAASRSAEPPAATVDSLSLQTECMGPEELKKIRCLL